MIQAKDRSEINKPLRILVMLGDLSGCYIYRVRNPMEAVTGYGIDYVCYPFLCNAPGRSQFEVLVDLLAGYDLVIIQRCYILAIVEAIHKACEFLGIPIVFETDDDYINLPLTNPAYLATIPPEVLKQSSTSNKVLYEARAKAIDDYKAIIGMADGITVSTEELKKVLFDYNRNIEVFENSLPSVWSSRDHSPEEACIDRDPNSPTFGKTIIRPIHGLWSIPDYYISNGQPIQCPRIGYTGTQTHRGEDWDTVKYYWEKLIDKYSNSRAWFVYIGDEYFFHEHENYRKKKGLPQRNLGLGAAEYDLYKLNIRNLDIGIAPLYPNIFNMSKSDIKALEYAAWCIPAVLPNYITYSRHWKNGENCLLYNNGREFQEAIETLINDPKLRVQLGINANKYVAENRLEKFHAKRRYEFYRSLVDEAYKFKVYLPKDRKHENNNYRSGELQAIK